MRQGFSLLELSIVLVIIGLIAGGIVAGASMIRAAELRAVITDYQQYQTAVYTFRDKYLGVPGDLKNSEAFWGTMSTGTCPNATSGTGTETCNGDGDGIIDFAAAANEAGEVFTFWQHLANAELINGTFTGRAGSGGRYDGELDENIPSAKDGSSGWSIVSWGELSGHVNIFDGSYDNMIMLGAATTSSLFSQSNMKPEEAWNIDKKTDDGMPATGTVRSRHRENCVIQSNGSVITTSAAHAALLDAEYNLGNDDIVCSFLFDLGL